MRVRTRLEEEEKGLDRNTAGERKERGRKPLDADTREPEATAGKIDKAPVGEGETGEQSLSPGAVHEEAGERKAAAAKKKAAEKDKPEMHDAGKVKLVKDVFGAEMIEEIKLGE